VKKVRPKEPPHNSIHAPSNSPHCVLASKYKSGRIQRIRTKQGAFVSAASTGDARAMNILRELHEAETELVGKTVVLTDGKAGTVDRIFLDDEHGLRISVAGHEGRWPISTVKHIEG